MTAPREVKLGSLTTQYLVRQMRQQNASARTGQSNTDNKWMSSSWTDAKAKAVQNSNSNNQAGNVAFSSVTDAMNLLNKVMSNSGSVASNSNQSTVSGNSNQARQSNAAGGASGAVQDNGSSYSGYAQSVSSGIGNVDTSTLSRIQQDIEWHDWSMSSGDYAVLKSDIAKESVKVNQSLAEAQANYSSLQTQKMTAEANVTRLEGQVDGAKNENETAKTSLENNTSNLNSSVQARDAMDEQLSSVNAEYKTACSAVKEDESSKANAQKEVSAAKTATGQAQAAFDIAAQSLDSAKAALAGTPKTLEDGKPNPQYAVAEAAVKKAELEKEQAQKSLDEAKKSQENAQTKLTESENKLKQSQQAKDNVLKTLQTSESKYKDMAQKCEKMQDVVEQNQEQYDKSLEVYDNSNQNYERLNSELEAQEGILTQYEAVENQVKSLKSSADSIKELEKKLDDKIKSKKEEEASKVLTPEKKSEIEQGILQNVDGSDGCSANKTPLENMLSCKDADLSKVANSSVLTTGTHLKGMTSADLENQGYLKNADGSFTDPRTGVTVVNFNGDNSHWASTDSLTSNGQVEEYYNHNLAGRDWAGAVDAAFRADSQSNVSIAGYGDDGKPKFKWK